MKHKFQFLVKENPYLACEAETEKDAWEWLSLTKRLTLKQVKELFKIRKIEK